MVRKSLGGNLVRVRVSPRLLDTKETEMINVKRIEDFVKIHPEFLYDEGTNYVSTADPVEMINYKAGYVEIPPVDLGRCSLLKQVKNKWQIFHLGKAKYVAATEENVDAVEKIIFNLVSSFFEKGTPNFDAMLFYKRMVKMAKQHQLQD